MGPLALFSLTIIGSLFISVFNTSSVLASSVTLTVPSSSLSLDIKPNSGTIFQKSSAGTINIKTDSSYGYSLSIHSKNSDSDSGKSNDLLNGSNKISSIASPLSESDFQTSGDNNTWDYLPSKLNGSTNDNFQPGPTSDPTTLDTTDSSSEGTDYNITLATKIDNTLPSGTYHNTFVLTAVSNDPAYDDIMQNWSGCDDLPEETKTLNLLDTRDNKTYTVAKLKDGKCWMTENLAIGKEDSEMTLTSEDSDVASSFNLPASVASVSQFNPSYQYDTSFVYVDNTYGGYYTWYAATAGEGTQSKSSGDVSHSICPKGWRLPTQSEFSTLANALGGTSSAGAQALMSEPANFLRGGLYNGGSSSSVGSRGYYWSASAYPSYNYNAYNLNFDSSSVSPAGSNTKSYGFSVRCVSRSSDPTMQNVEKWADSVETDQTFSATDTRDGKTYTVARLKDGHLWMTQNLALGDDALQNRELTSADSDLPDESTFTVPESKTSGFNDNTTAHIYVDATYGGYYSWAAATANTGNSVTNDGQEAAGSVCPKGWRLPTQAEYTALASQYGGDTSAGSNNLRNGTPKFVYAGDYRASSLYNQGSYGYYWSSTANNTSNAYIFYMYNSNAYTTGGTRYGGNSVRCISRTDDPIGTMQSVSDWADSVKEDQTVRATDTRDNKTYTVARLADNKLWMTQNLALGDTSLQTRTLTPENTDISSNYSLPTSSTSGFSDDSAENVYVDPTYGGYYTYNAATAGTGNSLTSVQEAPGSICPKGWRLPTQAEYTALATAYGGNNATGSAALRADPAWFVYSGYYYSSAPRVQGSGGGYWSSTAYDSSYAYVFYLGSSNAYVNLNNTRGRGFSVRCIARTDDPLPEMQKVSEWGSSVQKGQTISAVDTRDNKTYTVSRLADNKLWMTKNLEIEDYNLTSADSDVAGDFTLPASTNNPNSSNSYTSTDLHVDETYGGYYTWYTATAGEGTQSISSGDVSHSICPRGWKLPSRQDFIDLDKAFGGTGNNSQSSSTSVGGGKTLLQMYTEKPANFLMGGYYINGSASDVGADAYYWSSTAYSSSYAYYLYFYSSYVRPQHSDSKCYLRSVRCVSSQ